MEYPDVKDGFLVNALNDRNTWQTKVQALLMGPQGAAVLGVPCRHERVSNESIFRNWCFETMIGSIWGTPCVFRSGVALHHPLWRASRDMLCEPRPEASVKAHMPLRPVEIISVHAALALLRNEERAELFMLVEWADYKLIVPCNYLNYAPPDSPEVYVQPITGYALFPGESVDVAWVAAYIGEDESLVEFQLRRPTALKNLVRVGPLNRIAIWLTSLLPWSLAMQTDEFCEVRPVAAEAKLIRYL